MEALFLCLAGSLLAALITLPRGSTSFLPEACVVGDTFTVSPERYTYWNSGRFFKINLFFGILSFEEAKVIDIFWDVLVGRGGQTTLAFFSWRAFIDYVTISMEIAPVTFDTFRAIFLENTPSIYSISLLIRDFTSRKRLQSRIAMFFIVTSMLFSLLFPTLASAMTGYTTHVIAQIDDITGKSIPFNEFRLLLFTIHDGQRVNLTK
ncbi:hypothetical protein DM02DRAFT_515836, partial [Periconia macrospinosa]